MSFWLKLEHEEATKILKEISEQLAKEVATGSILSHSLSISEELIRTRAKIHACEVAINQGLVGVESRLQAIEWALSFLAGGIDHEDFDVITWGTHFDHAKWLELTEEGKILTFFHKRMSILK